MFIRTILTVAFGLCCVYPAVAQSVDDANAALRGDPPKAAAPALPAPAPPAPVVTAPQPPPQAAAQDAPATPKAAPAPAPVPQPQPLQAGPTPAAGAPFPVLSKGDLLAGGTASTVYILALAKDRVGSGSGFALAPDLVMTNRHVVEGAKTIIVIGTDRKRSEAEVVAIESRDGTGDRDFALLRLAKPAPARPAVVLSNFYAPLSAVHAFGFPGLVGDSERKTAELFAGDKMVVPTVVVSSGTVQNVMENQFRVEVLTHSAKIAPGNSGGPLFDACGRVVGINTYLGAMTVVALGAKGKAKAESVPTGYQWALSGGEMLKFLRSRGVDVAVDSRRCE